MTLPILLGVKGYQAPTYSATLDTSSDPIDFGVGTGRWIAAIACTANNGVTPDSISAPVGRTLEAGALVPNPMGTVGNLRAFRLVSDHADTGVPSGIATLTLTCSSAVAMPQMIVAWGYNATAISWAAFLSASGANPSFSIDSNGNSLAMLLAIGDSETVAGGNGWTAPFTTHTATLGATLAGFQRMLSGRHNQFALHEVGAPLGAVGVTIADYRFTPVTGGVPFSIAGLPDPSDLAGSAQLADVNASGTLGEAPVSALAGTAQLADAAPTGTLGAQPGTITTNVWKNAAGDVLPSQSVPLVTVLRMSDGLQVLTLTNQSTSASPTAPNWTITNGGLIAGVWYMVAAWNADGSVAGIEPYQAL